jgi:putative transposase
LEALVISGWVRGLSTRDIEAALAETLGPDATVSKSTVPTICAAVREQFDAFGQRDLSGVELAYLYVDASHFRYHHAADAEPVLVAYGRCSPNVARTAATRSRACSARSRVGQTTTRSSA